MKKKSKVLKFPSKSGKTTRIAPPVASEVKGKLAHKLGYYFMFFSLSVLFVGLLWLATMIN